MNKLRLSFMALLWFSIPCHSQDLVINKDLTAELTKTSRSARYGGTLFNDEQAKVVFISSTKNEGVQLEQYDFNINDGAFKVADKFVDANDASKQFPWFMPKSQVDKVANGSGSWLRAGRAFGSAMKLERGHIQKNYTLGVYTGMEFVKEEAIKPKTGDIWRITPGGFKSLSDYDALATSNGFYQDLDEYGNPLLMPADANLLAAGVIQEKVKLSKDQEFASNRVAVLTMNGVNFDDMKYEIYLLPYTALTVTSGLGQEGNMCSLFAPLNGPTTLSSLKHLYWKNNQEHMTLMRFNDERKLIDSVSFQSKMMHGEYQILNAQNSTFVLSRGVEESDGWYKVYALKKINGMQVVKINDGKVEYAKEFTKEMLDSKVIGAGGKNVKFKLRTQGNNFDEVLGLPDGGALVFGHNPLQSYVLQLSSKGDLEALYFTNVGEEGKIGIVNYQYTVKDNKLIYVVNLQPAEFSTLAQVETRTSSSQGGGIKTTTTTTTVKKLNEVYLQSMVYRIDMTNKTMSNALAFDSKSFYTMGSFPAVFMEDSMYFTGKEKGPKGKVIHVARIDY